MISKEKKTAIMNEYARTPGDTGSPEVQVAVLTARIQELTDHLISVHLSILAAQTDCFTSPRCPGAELNIPRRYSRLAIS